ncbi:hypothetical protein FGE05_25105 [Pseudomonas sp. ICMP22404]|nr:hypothetical protein FGE05_25105 [Pseudomonas sp. ICMP22404]
MGASLLAIAVDQLAAMLHVPTSSRAGSLPQGFGCALKTRCDFPLPTLTCGHVLRGRLCTSIFSVFAALSWVRWRSWPRSWAIM